MRASARFGLLALVIAACTRLTSPVLAAPLDPPVLASPDKDCPKPPPEFSNLRTVQCALAGKPGEMIHIVYVHGIRASAPGFSEDFRKTVCKYMTGGCPAPVVSRHYLNMGPTPAASFLGDVVWNDETWKASWPFVEHYVYKPRTGPTVVVDEVNYWPLLLALKCQYLVPQDASLSGPDKADIAICAGHPKPTSRTRTAPDPGQGPYLYPWIDTKAEATLLATRPVGGGGALINKMLKTSILTWGISDAVIALGPMKKYTRLAIWCAFEEIEVFDPDAAPIRADTAARSCEAKNNALPKTDKQFVVISESLGSFALLDAFAKATYLSEHRREYRASDARPTPDEGSALQFIVKRSDNIYFFANQFALLELARIEALYPSDPGAAGSEVAISNTLRDWAKAGSSTGGAKQLVAFNDPSDILTYRVPDFCENPHGPRFCPAIVQNIPVRNSFRWFGLFERPDRAHTYYSRNPKVLKVIFGVAPPPRPAR